MILSGLSDPYVLTEEGFREYTKSSLPLLHPLFIAILLTRRPPPGFFIFWVRPHTYRSIGYSNECLGLHIGNIHEADLGDGNGRMPEMYLARQAYFPVWGTCWESFAGGHHFRAWRQNGTHADSGAWFIGSVPPPLRFFFFFCGSQTLNERTAERRKRSIRRSGTRSSRMVITSVATGSSSVLWRAVIRKDATSGGVPKSSGTLNSSSLVIRVRGYALPFFSGRGLTFGGAGRLGVNHGIAQDGRVAVLTVFRV